LDGLAGSIKLPGSEVVLVGELNFLQVELDGAVGAVPALVLLPFFLGGLTNMVQGGRFEAVLLDHFLNHLREFLIHCDG
jgi:hypothetical protein